MRMPMVLLSAAVLSMGIISGWAANQTERPVDALSPENDRLAQLERRVLQLEDRLRQVERTQSPTGTLPAMHWMSPSIAAPPRPLPDPQERELNGVRYQFRLLGSETPPTRR